MRHQELRAAELAEQLAKAASREPRTDQTPERIRIEADLPDKLTNSARDGILAAITQADRYGHSRTEHGEVAWMELDLRKTS